MDTQGFDLNVFRGARGCLSQVVGLQTELSVQALYEGMPCFDEVIGELSAGGYKITGMYPVARDKRDLSLIELDCVMIRSN
jgi:hypothetical protein